MPTCKIDTTPLICNTHRKQQTTTREVQQLCAWHTCLYRGAGRTCHGLTPVQRCAHMVSVSAADTYRHFWTAHCPHTPPRPAIAALLALKVAHLQAGGADGTTCRSAYTHKQGNRAHLDAARWPTGTGVETEQQTNGTRGGSPTGCDGQCHAKTEPQCLRFAFKVEVRSTRSTALGHAWVTHKSRCGPDEGSSTRVNVT